jgi:hypothetical protein
MSTCHGPPRGALEKKAPENDRFIVTCPTTSGNKPLCNKHLWSLVGRENYFSLAARPRRSLDEALSDLCGARLADYLALGGGDVKQLETSPDNARPGHHRTVIEGGRRL